MKSGLSKFYVGILLLIPLAACKKKQDAQTPQQILASVEWKTTKVLNKATGAALRLDTAPAKTYVGLATYRQDGTFEFKDLNGMSRTSNFARGNWGVSLDGKQRILVFSPAMNMTARISRIVTITELNNRKFTYEIGDSVGATGSRTPVTLLVEHEPK